jgi:hypothetical protein
MTNGVLSLASAGLGMMGAAQAAEAEGGQAKMQAELLRQQAENERQQAEYNADMQRRQREMEKVQERRDYERDLARARVGGLSAESLLAGADRFNLSSNQKDWLTGRQTQGMLNSAAQHSAALRAQANAYGAKAKGANGAGMNSLLQGGLQAFSTIYGMFGNSGSTTPTTVPTVSGGSSTDMGSGGLDL